MPTTTLVASDPDRIRDDLVDGIRQNNDMRRRRNTRVLGSMSVVLVALVGFAAWTTTTSEPAYAFRESDQGVIEVEIYPDFDDVDGLQDELAAAGVEALVIPLRGHPSLDGLVEVVSHDGEADGSIVRSFDGRQLMLDPAEVTAPVEILVYSAANEGESYQFAPSIFALGQPLAGLPCALTDRPLTSAEVEARAAGVGLSEVRWIYHDGDWIEERDERPDGIVAEAQLASADVLRVIVRPAIENELPAADLYGEYAANSGSHARVGPAPCTPELAEAWS